MEACSSSIFFFWQEQNIQLLEYGQYKVRQIDRYYQINKQSTDSSPFFLQQMYKFKTSRDQQQSTLLTLAAHQSLVVVKASRLQATHQVQAQSRLLLQFVIHENHDDSSNWSALEHSLKEKFDDVIAGDLIPFCNLKIHVYILHAASHLESTITNAVWSCLLLHGVPMRRSIFHFQWRENEQKGQCVLDLNDPSKIITAQANSLIPASATSECLTFKKELTSFLSQQWSR